MFSYMVGKVISQNKKSITFESNWTGYVIHVSRPESFEVGKVRKIYIFKHIITGTKNNIVEEMYGFDRYEQKDMFLSLISISGIGPKTAIGICRNDIKTLRQLIASQDIEALSVMDGITPKYAKILVDNLIDEMKKDKVANTNLDVGALVQALKSLGYVNKDIEFAVQNMDTSRKDIELSDLISEAIKTIATGTHHDHIVEAN